MTSLVSSDLLITCSECDRDHDESFTSCPFCYNNIPKNIDFDCAEGEEEYIQTTKKIKVENPQTVKNTEETKRGGKVPYIYIKREVYLHKNHSNIPVLLEGESPYGRFVDSKGVVCIECGSRYETSTNNKFFICREERISGSFSLVFCEKCVTTNDYEKKDLYEFCAIFAFHIFKWCKENPE